MTTSRASGVFLGLLALGAAGCELARDEGKRRTPTSEPERTEEVATILSSAPANWTPTTAAATTREEPKKATKKDEPPPVAPIDTRTLEGTVRATDAQRRLISIVVSGKSQTFPVESGAPVENLADQSHALKGGLAAIRPGASVLLVIYRNKADREIVSLIRVKGMTK